MNVRIVAPAVAHVTVVVPAHDEVALIDDCLRSIALAARTVSPVPVGVVVVLDACADGTESVVRSGRHTGIDVEVRSVDLRRVGAVRAAGLVGAPRGPGSWYATTDADSVVPPRWLAVQLESARSHDLFLGTVRVVDWSPRRNTVERAYAARYGTGSTHRHVHATNLGIRAETYWDIGGFADVTAHEDERLVGACLEAGARIDWNSAAPVVTSARHSDRTPAGFSSYLGELESELPA